MFSAPLNNYCSLEGMNSEEGNEMALVEGQLSSAEEQAEVKLISLSVFAGAEKSTECEVEAMVKCAADEDMLVVELAS